MPEMGRESTEWGIASDVDERAVVEIAKDTCEAPLPAGMVIDGEKE